MAWTDAKQIPLISIASEGLVQAGSLRTIDRAAYGKVGQKEFSKNLGEYLESMSESGGNFDSEMEAHVCPRNSHKDQNKKLKKWILPSHTVNVTP